MLTYTELEKENDVLATLLLQAYNHAFHHQDCAAVLELESHDEVDESSCNCFMAAIEAYLGAPLDVAVAPSSNICGCGHTVSQHTPQGERLCVANGCDCFKYTEKSIG